MAVRSAQEIWIDDAARRAGFADRIAQLYRAATRELVATIDDVTTLPKDLRTALVAEGFTFDSVEPLVVQHSTNRQTIKGLLRLRDGNEAEAVLM